MTLLVSSSILSNLREALKRAFVRRRRKRIFVEMNNCEFNSNNKNCLLLQIIEMAVS